MTSSRGADGSDGGTPKPRREFSGIAASPGIGIGPAYLVDRRRIQVPHYAIERDAVRDEIKRFRDALRTTQEQLEAVKARLPHGEHRQILKAQQMMLRDPDLTGDVEARIRDELVNAEWAMMQVAKDVERMLEEAEDEVFRERSSDVAHLANRVLRNLLGRKDETIDPPAGAVVVAYDLSPADTAGLARADVGGIVTEIGGRTSHSAIMARSLEIPAVVGVEDVTATVQSHDLVIVDGIHGRVVVRPSDDEVAHWQEVRRRYDEFEDRIQRDHALPATTLDGVRVVLRANAALDEEVASASFHGAEGIGLYRTEYIFMNRDAPPAEEEHYRRAKDVLCRVAPHPVTFRTFDLGADKVARYVGVTEPGANPALGVRSLRLALREREIFIAQIKGLLRAALHGPLRIMLPFVSGLEELEQAMDVVREAKERLVDDGMAHLPDVPVGIMVEMPAAALAADLLAPHVDFLSIGTNDLIQYTLAIDRENDDVGYLYEPLHPAIVRQLRTVADAGRAAGIPVSLCGEMAADPRYTWVLVGLGIRELSMHPSAIPVVKNIVRQSVAADMEALAAQVTTARSGLEAERMVRAVMAERFPEHLEHGGADAVAPPVAAGSVADRDGDPHRAPGGGRALADPAPGRAGGASGRGPSGGV